MKLIDRDTLAAEIEKYHKDYLKKAKTFVDDANYWIGKADAYRHILTILDTLEVREVDLEIEQRMKECPYRQVGCTMYKDKVLECRGACSWVVDYLKFKEQKGEEV